jgi:hypothetical protein
MRDVRSVTAIVERTAEGDWVEALVTEGATLQAGEDDMMNSEDEVRKDRR